MPHIHEKIDFVADVFVVFQDKVLLRKHEKYNLWLSVGGHIELDEDPNQAAIREVKEEVGLDIRLFRDNKQDAAEGTTIDFVDVLPGNVGDLIPPQYLNRHRINEHHEHVSLIYFATSQSDTIAPASGEANVECRWFTQAELEENAYGIRPGVLFYAKQALAALGV